jgi:hypothetical protein
VGDSAVVPDGADNFERSRVATDVVDRDGQAIAGKTPGDGAASPRELPVTRATRCCVESAGSIVSIAWLWSAMSR